MPNLSFTMTIIVRISGENMATVAVWIISGVDSRDILKILL